MRKKTETSEIPGQVIKHGLFISTLVLALALGGCSAKIGGMSGTSSGGSQPEVSSPSTQNPSGAGVDRAASDQYCQNLLRAGNASCVSALPGGLCGQCYLPPAPNNININTQSWLNKTFDFIIPTAAAAQGLSLRFASDFSFINVAPGSFCPDAVVRPVRDQSTPIENRDGATAQTEQIDATGGSGGSSSTVSPFLPTAFSISLTQNGINSINHRCLFDTRDGRSLEGATKILPNSSLRLYLVAPSIVNAD